MSSKKVDFGFKQIEESKKQGLVGEIFSSVAPKYDLMNDLMSFGIHRLWKNKLIAELEPDKALLDVASGTGDLVKRYYLKCNNPNITMSDINKDMLNTGRDRLLNENIFQGINFVECNAEKLPFQEFSFDYYTIAFGIRNVTNIKASLQEASRVLKPGGKFVCLEFAQVDNPLFKQIYDYYSINIIPKIGKLIANDEYSYQYLVESIRRFPEQEEFVSLMEEAGLKLCRFENLSFGIVAMYIGYKI